VWNNLIKGLVAGRGITINDYGKYVTIQLSDGFHCSDCELNKQRQSRQDIINIASLSGIALVAIYGLFKISR
jgi:hypothetical protein